MKGRLRSVTIALTLLSALSFSSVGCFGPFNLTRQLHSANAEFEHPWAEEGIFVISIPAYGFAALGDMLVFNSIEFWSGENPIDAPGDS